MSAGWTPKEVLYNDILYQLHTALPGCDQHAPATPGTVAMLREQLAKARADLTPVELVRLEATEAMGRAARADPMEE